MYANGTVEDFSHSRCSDGSETCRKLNGSALADGMFCVLEGDDYHTVGPYCYAGLCTIIGRLEDEVSPCEVELGGIPIGEFICIIQGDYTVVPVLIWDNAVHFDGYESSEENSNVFRPFIGARNYMLNGSYSVYGPTCYGPTCYDGDCGGAGGVSIGGIYCAIPDSSDVVPSTSAAVSIHSSIICILSFAFMLVC